MKEEHKAFIEKIIQEFRESENGYINANTYTKLFCEDHKLRIALSKMMMDDLGLIYKVNSLGYRLTKDGWDFKGFQELERIDNQKTKRDAIELENIESSVKVNKWLLKTKWLPHIFSVLAIGVSIYLGKESSEKSEELDMRIKKLERSIDSINKVKTPKVKTSANSQ